MCLERRINCSRCVRAAFEVAPRSLLEMSPPRNRALWLPYVLRQAVLARVKEMGLPAGLDAGHVAQALGEGRGSQADLVVAIMKAKGTECIDFYEV